jgi:tRNA modification GTPase
LELDFSQEDVEFADRKQLNQLIGQARERVGRLLHSFRLGNVIRNGVSVAIIGQPNAGKSTLLNALLQEDRAIVSDIAGTTRDTIEETLNIDGILFRLIDTAGIRSHTIDRIESIGISKSWEKAAQADIIILLFDVHETTVEELRQQWQGLQDGKTKALLVGNKADGQPYEQWKDKFKELGEPVEFISAKEGMHLEVLKEHMVDKVLSGAVQSEGTIITNARHYHALKEVERSLSDITAGLDQQVPGDLLALDIRRCLHYLGEITGAITNEDQLDYIFSKFCIGK